MSPNAFPIERDVENGEYALMDLGGDGKLDLVVNEPTRSGYYQSRTDGAWDAYQSFAATPTDFYTPNKAMVDVTGDGLADLVIFKADAVKVYPSKGKGGYGLPMRRANENQLPITTNPSAEEAVRFADPFGDGGSHLVRIKNGSVECWPNLGYGRFGEKVMFKNAPRFSGEMDASRLFLADIDGSGTADLIYVHHDRVDVYYNQSGNGFSDPVPIPLPRRYDDLDQINFADVLGNGTSYLVLTSLSSDLRLNHEYYDFTGEVKPHLLIEQDNNMGTTTRVQYTPSTKFYLEDEQAGRPWVTKLAFPVQLIEKVETIDNISGSKLVSRYKYHDGYYDPVQREFRGFGFVERWDSEPFNLEIYLFKGDDADLYVAPVYTKTWYHTGAYIEAGVLSTHYQDEYYKGDSEDCLLPDTVFETPFEPVNAETFYEAYLW